MKVKKNLFYIMLFISMILLTGCVSTESSSSDDSSSSSDYSSRDDSSENESDSDNDFDEDSDSDNDSDGDNTSYTYTIILPTSYSIDDGRLLGSQCAGCHGTNGVSSSSFDSIINEDNLVSEFHDNEDALMNAQANGYTNEEVQSIQDWLNTL